MSDITLHLVTREDKAKVVPYTSYPHRQEQVASDTIAPEQIKKTLFDTGRHGSRVNLTPALASKQRVEAYTVPTREPRAPDWFTQAVEAERLKRTMGSADNLAGMLFPEAARIWLEGRKDKHRPRTFEVYSSYANLLSKFLKEVQLCQIDMDIIKAYQTHRKPLAAASTINHEIECILIPMLRKIGIWQKIKDEYSRPSGNGWQPPKVLSEEEENRVFLIASSNPDWSLAYWVCSITCNTSASGQELRMMRFQDVDLSPDNPKFRVPPKGAKNGYRDRIIPMNETAFKQFRRVVDRAISLGAGRPEHYIFPFREAPGRYDPTRPMSRDFIRVPFRNLKNAVEIPWLTPHCFRHQLITKMLEAGVPEQTVMATAGHVSRQMMEHYSHTRIQAKRDALDLIMPKAKAKGA